MPIELNKLHRVSGKMMRVIARASPCAALGLIVSVSVGQEQPAKKAPDESSNSPTGGELYKQHCAVCHGDDLKGSGPFPPPYRVPPDLTTLARRYGGRFPGAYVAKVLRNGVTLPAHGPAEMPVWGAEFAETGRLSKTQVELRIKNLTNYIRSFQNHKPHSHAQPVRV